MDAQQLTITDKLILSSWPPALQLRIPGLGNVLFCHATPHNNTEAAVRATSYPGADVFAAHHILRPPSEAEILAQFSLVEL